MGGAGDQLVHSRTGPLAGSGVFLAVRGWLSASIWNSGPCLRLRYGQVQFLQHLCEGLRPSVLLADDHTHVVLVPERPAALCCRQTPEGFPEAELVPERLVQLMVDLGAIRRDLSQQRPLLAEEGEDSVDGHPPAVHVVQRHTEAFGFCLPCSRSG